MNKGYSKLTLPLAIFLKKFIKHHQSNGYGFIKERPFRNYLLKHYKKSKTLGLRLIISNQMRLEDILSFFDLFYYKRAVIFNHEEKETIMGFYKESNQSLDLKYDLDPKKWKYY